MNMLLLSNYDDNSLLSMPDGTVYNDVWGYTDGIREYAIVGTITGFLIVEVTDPSSPQLVLSETGASNYSLWRDFKTYQNYLYAISDQGASSSLQVYDLSGLSGGSISKVYDSQTHFSTAHNIFVNPASGRLYVAGSSSSPSGVIILDIATNPASPAMLASYSLGAYVHDVYVHRDTCVAFFGNSGVGLFDFANLSNPSAIDMLVTAYPDQGYAHSGFATPDFKYLYWATETHDTGLKISDFSTGLVLDPTVFFRSAMLGPSNDASVPHNPFIQGDYLYTSYYHDGIQVWDISNRKSPTLAAYYDTFGNHSDYTGFKGCWGVYPFLPSGNILATDKENGLFVLSMNSTFPVELKDFRAENLEGQVQLSWTTTQETNNDHFRLERSPDGIEFEQVARVQGVGNSDEEVNYEWYDPARLEGKVFYRLTQVDLDGAEHFSEVLSIDLSPVSELLSVGPNPAVSGQDLSLQLALSTGGKIEARMYNLQGALVYQSTTEAVPGQNELFIPTRDQAAGTYLIKVVAPDQVHTHKLVLR